MLYLHRSISDSTFTWRFPDITYVAEAAEAQTPLRNFRTEPVLICNNLRWVQGIRLVYPAACGACRKGLSVPFSQKLRTDSIQLQQRFWRYRAHLLKLLVLDNKTFQQSDGSAVIVLPFFNTLLRWKGKLEANKVFLLGRGFSTSDSNPVRTSTLLIPFSIWTNLKFPSIIIGLIRFCCCSRSKRYPWALFRVP